MIPTLAETDAHLAYLLRRGSVNLGKSADCERLLLMLTRSCELRCGYCFVQKQEDARELSLADAKRSVDLLMRSERNRLAIQFFGGEPGRAWPVLYATIVYAAHHPQLAGRRIEMVLTTNGLGLSVARLATLSQYPVKILFSLDGDREAHRRFRSAYLLDDQAAYDGIAASLRRLLGGAVPWFMNAVLPPAAADQVVVRYRWALSQGIPALQLNYAVGMRWSQSQREAFIGGVLDVLRDDHENPGRMQVYNWASKCEPVMLSDDLIVDVDGTVLHDGAVFLERAFGELKRTYRRGHLDDLVAFDPLRWDLATLHKVMVDTYPPGSHERAVIVDNCRLGAALDLAIDRLARELGR